MCGIKVKWNAHKLIKETQIYSELKTNRELKIALSWQAWLSLSLTHTNTHTHIHTNRKWAAAVITIYTRRKKERNIFSHQIAVIKNEMTWKKTAFIHMNSWNLCVCLAVLWRWVVVLCKTAVSESSVSCLSVIWLFWRFWNGLRNVLQCADGRRRE